MVSTATITTSRPGREQADMAASFLQFCATCEKQIYTPSNYILYCSEACRRTDSTKPVFPIRPTLPSSFPTGSPFSASCSRIPSSLHTVSSDLDPTEWKPKLPRTGTSASSEACRYLSRFHRSLIHPDHPDGLPQPTLRSAYTSSTSIFSLNTANTPSLAQSPTTASSSLNTNADYFTPPGDFNTRPLPPRHDPSYASCAGVTRSIDLVMPHAPPFPDCTMPATLPPQQQHLALHSGLWEKQKVREMSHDVPSSTKEGLSALFRIQTV